MQPEASVIVTLEGTVSPSEDSRKVAAAMASFFGEAKFSTEEGERVIRMNSSDRRGLFRLHDQLRDRRVRGVARRRLLAGREGNQTTVILNRQAAAAGVLVLCDREDESPLGPFYLTLESSDLDRVIEWLTAYPGG